MTKVVCPQVETYAAAILAAILAAVLVIVHQTKPIIKLGLEFHRIQIMAK